MNQFDLLQKLKSTLGEALFESIKAAYFKAETAHKNQIRDNGDPYIIHPLRVCLILAEELKITDIESLSIALLHDTVEDCNVSLEEIATTFSKTISDGVKCLTKHSDFKENISSQNKYFWHLKRAPKNVQIIKLADRLDNVRDLSTCPDELKKRKYILDTAYNYLEWAKQVSPYIAAELEDFIFKYKDQFRDFDI